MNSYPVYFPKIHIVPCVKCGCFSDRAVLRSLDDKTRHTSISINTLTTFLQADIIHIFFTEPTELDSPPLIGSSSSSPIGSHPGTPLGLPAGSHPGTPLGSPPGSHPGTPLGSPPGSHPGTPIGSRPGTPTTKVDVNVDVDYEIKLIMTDWRESLNVHRAFELDYLNSYTDDISETFHDFRFWGDGVGEGCKTKAGYCKVEINLSTTFIDRNYPDPFLGHIFQDRPGDKRLSLLALDYNIRRQALQHQRDRQRGSTSAHAR
ncbi:hypothetical protein FB446DRAFT_337426 [Lentinula raphanica]|nr:hypothetical protein FB446DRAFT_337426 [Lentinula raphanica]